MKRALRFMLYMVAALVVTTLVAIVLIVKLALAPASGEWSQRVEWGPIGFEVGVPTVVRLVTASWFAPQLAGREFETAFGTLRFGWNEGANVQELHCDPCSIAAPGLGEQPVTVQRLTLTVRRDVDALFGSVQAVPAGSGAAAQTALRGRWNGRLTQKGLQLSADMEDAPIAQWYQVLVPGLPELGRARIGGTVALRGQLAMPEQVYGVQPRLTQFSVDGLGAQALLEARETECGSPARLAPDSWLARGVVAAQDPDFLERGADDAAALGTLFSTPKVPGAKGEKGEKAPRASNAPSAGNDPLSLQLVRRLLPPAPRAGEGRLRELLYAVELERTPGKIRLLQGYLDSTPWGEQMCGAEAAARRYFKRPARQLEPAQAMWLAAMVQAPDAALQKWRDEGQIDKARTKTVSDAVRGITPGQRHALLRGVAAARFPPPP